MSQEATMSRPLEGVRILEVAQFTFVPAAAALLSDWGAEVIKIEPLAGDAQRRMVQTLGLGGSDASFLPTVQGPNRGKRSVALELGQPAAREVLGRLVASCDVLMTNVVPSTRERLGLAYEQVRHHRTDIVYVSGTGFGARGDEVNSRSFDMTAFWARSGAAAEATGEGADTMMFPPVPAFGDNVAALAVAGGVAAALYARQQHRRGAVVDISLHAVGAWTTQHAVNLALETGSVGAAQAPGRKPTPLMGGYRTSDDRWILFATAEPERHWASVFHALGRADLVEDQRFRTAEGLRKHADSAIDLLASAMREKDAAYWVGALASVSIPWSLVQTPAEVGQDPSLRANGQVAPVLDDLGVEHHLVGSPVQFDGRAAELSRAPVLGEHTGEVLTQLGYSDEELTDLRRHGIISG